MDIAKLIISIKGQKALNILVPPVLYLVSWMNNIFVNNSWRLKHYKVKHYIKNKYFDANEAK